MVASDSDEQLTARLDCALRAGLGSDQVDVAGLLSGSQARARQLRSQRIGLAIAAAVLVVALPVGWEVTRPDAGAEAAPSALLVHSPHPSVHPPPSPVPSKPAGGPAGSGAASDPGLEPSGSQLSALAQAMLPAGLTLRSSQYLTAPSGPIIGGLVCPPPPGATAPSDQLAASRWVWGPAKVHPAVFTVTLSYTRWATGPAANAFVAQTHGGGGCHWLAPQLPALVDEPLAGDVWAATSSSNGVNAGRVAVRIGDDIVGVEVQGGSTQAALALAQRVAHVEAVRLSTVRRNPGT